VVVPKSQSSGGFSTSHIIALVIGVLLAIALGGLMIWFAYATADGYGPGSAVSQLVPLVPKS
jgi:hypothetical protein